MGKLEQYRKGLYGKQAANKFNVDKKKCNGFDSYFESQINDNLVRMQKHYEFEFRYHVDTDNIHWYTNNKYSKRYEAIGVNKEDIVNDKIHHIYEPDFVIVNADGSKVYLEVKGWLQPEDRTKMKVIKKLYPDLDIRFVFQKKQNLKLKSGESNIEWALNNGFDNSITGALIPKSWFK